MTIAVDMGRKATKTNKTNDVFYVMFFYSYFCPQLILQFHSGLTIKL